MKPSKFVLFSLFLISSISYAQGKAISTETKLAIRDAQHEQATVAQEYMDLNQAVQQEIQRRALPVKVAKANSALEAAIDKAYTEAKLSKEKYDFNPATYEFTEKKAAATGPSNIPETSEKAAQAGDK